MTATRQPPKTNPQRTNQRDAGHGKTPRQPSVDREMRHVGIGIDTGRYGHHVSFLREDKQRAATPMTVMEKAGDYAKLQQRLEQLQQRFPNAHLHLTARLRNSRRSNGLPIGCTDKSNRPRV